MHGRQNSGFCFNDNRFDCNFFRRPRSHSFMEVLAVINFFCNLLLIALSPVLLPIVLVKFAIQGGLESFKEHNALAQYFRELFE